MATEDDKVWVNTLMEKKLVEKLDEMVAENGSDRAKFVRLLISNEYENRKKVRRFMAKMREKGVIQ